MRHSLATLCLSFAVAVAPIASLAEIAGLREGHMPAPHHGRDMAYALWYPAQPGAIPMPHFGNPVFQPILAAIDATPAEGRNPLVLLSHGLGGHYRSLGWLATGLAKAGALVLAVNHPESSFGDFDMQAGLRHWTRAQDLRLALDHLLADPVFGPLVDPERISAVGFSYGGWTALGLGGLRGNLAGYAAACTLQPTRHCDDIARAGVDLAQLDAALWDGDHSDSRIGRVAAIDPGLTYGLTAQDAAGLRVPTLLVQLGMGTDRLDATDISAQGSYLTALLPSATLVQIAPAAHFSVLPLCTAQGAAILRDEGDDPVCTDPDGALRADIHAQVLTAMRAHLGLD
ncbi:alpha/beta hydrolase family protein [Roseibaca sp. Y0-43]|uniref:alpha/beta hydrolase family protein n=1 Tax=Roseibaca sp. Y0-43 TaxID=2816854 RepID=UPI001D0C1774|nr:hypothetical protein [Roseibaca sp. Y0-43]MCC1480761.1 hypothetical protein [Roseibaca sp. Y0-43]